jgi:hypothetical protein
MFELIPGGKVTFQPGSIFNAHQQALLNHVPHDQDERDAARNVLLHRAPDLVRMVMGE